MQFDSLSTVQINLCLSPSLHLHINWPVGLSVCSAAQHNDMFTSSQIPIKIPEVGDKDSVCV